MPSLSRLHLSSVHPHLIPELLSSWEGIIDKENGQEVINGENDKFLIESQEGGLSVKSLVKSLPDAVISATEDKPTVELAGGGDGIIDYNAIPKRLIPHETDWPGTKETPSFNHHVFYSNLKHYQQEKSSEAEEFGNILLYGEVVTSTNTMLEKWAFSLL